jgi:putative ABC transport system substrate-binding protein
MFSVQRAYSTEIAIIKSNDISSYNQALSGFNSLFSSAKVTVYEMNGSLETGKGIVEEVRSKKPDLILSIGIKATKLVQEKIDNIPIVFCMVMNPENYELKGLNITGVSLDIPMIRQLQASQSLIPSIKKIGVIYDPKINKKKMKELERASLDLGIDLIIYKVESAKEVPQALRDIIPNIDALWLIPDSTVVTKDSFQHILVSLLDNNKPLFSFSDKSVEAGALLSFEADFFSVGKQSGIMAKRILAGENPGSIPVEYFKKNSKSFNEKIAKKLGLEINRSDIQGIEKVYQ